MSKENLTLLLDTNVWLDCYLGHRQGHAAAMSLMAFAERHNVTLAYASLSAKDVFYLLGSDIKRIAREEKGALSQADALHARKIAWECVRNMSEIAVAIPVGEPQVWLAARYEDIHGDFEDDLVLAALETSKADFLVTNDEVLCRKASKGALSATDMLAYLECGCGIVAG